MQLVARPFDGRGLSIEDDLVRAAHRAELGGGVDHDLGEITRLMGDDAADVGAREQQQIRDEAAHAL